MEKLLQIGKEFGLDGEKLLEFVREQQKLEEERRREEEEKEEKRRQFQDIIAFAWIGLEPKKVLVE